MTTELETSSTDPTLETELTAETTPSPEMETPEIPDSGEKESGKTLKPDANTSEIVDKNGAKQAVKPPYLPNYKYKVLDKEQEFDAFLKGVIKDPETEKKVRELYEKANGLDFVKKERQSVRTELSQERERSEQAINYIKTASSLEQKGDMHSFFQFLGIHEDKILKYALERIQYRELGPEQRAIVDQQQSAALRSLALEQQNQQLQQNFAQVAQNQRSMELQAEISKPDVSNVVQSFDARVGKPGAFQQAVIERGQYHWFKNKVDIPVSQAVAEVLSLINGYGVSQNGAGAVVDNSQAQMSGAGSSPAQNPHQPTKQIIPNIRGSGTSPVRKVPGSIEDLKKIARQKAAEQ